MIEKVVSSALMIISFIYLFAAINLNFGSFSKPMEGFMPTLVGILACILAITNFISTVIKKHDRDNKKENKMSDIDIRKLIKFVLGCLVFVFLIRYTGFIITTIIVLTYLLKVTEVEGWILPLIVSTSTAVGFYFLFERLLGVMLP